MSILAVIGLGIWVALVCALAWDDARREEPTRDVEAFYARVERTAQELKGRDG